VSQVRTRWARSTGTRTSRAGIVGSRFPRRHGCRRCGKVGRPDACPPRSHRCAVAARRPVSSTGHAGPSSRLHTGLRAESAHQLIDAFPPRVRPHAIAANTHGREPRGGLRQSVGQWREGCAPSLDKPAASHAPVGRPCQVRPKEGLISHGDRPACDRPPIPPRAVRTRQESGFRSSNDRSDVYRVLGKSKRPDRGKTELPVSGRVHRGAAFDEVRKHSSRNAVRERFRAVPGPIGQIGDLEKELEVNQGTRRGHINRVPRGAC